MQTPCRFGDKFKANCYVFDFAPDRALKMVTEFVKISARAGKATSADRKNLDALLKFCPVIAVEGSEMKQLDARKLLERIKDAQAERIVQNGFADNNLYSDKLLDLTAVDWQILNGAKKVVGTSKDPTKKIVINEQGLTDDEQTDGTKKKSARTPEQKELDKKKNDRSKAIAILRQVSIRMPLLIYGADVPLNEKITAKRFAEIVDDDSWVEFMPAGFTRKMFTDLIPYYDPINFVNAAKKVRQRAKAADKLTPTERVKKIAALFATFKNPDKETVLTPWRVVNLHMTETFGGWNFFADNPPQLVPTEIFHKDSHILEINSKTGLYPLFVAYSIYRARLEAEGVTEETDKDISEEDRAKHLDKLREFWDATVAENVFVICKTPMAKTITRRTLLGYRAGSVNAHCFDDLINTLKFKADKFVARVTNKNFWNKGAGKMFFDAVVGNPPYQITGSGDNKTFAASVYNLFMENSFKLADKVSLVTPARFLFNAGATPQDFRNRMLADTHLKVVRYVVDGKKLFPTSDIKGGVVITLHDMTKTFEPIGTFIPFDELKSIHQKVVVDNKNFQPLNEIMFASEIYHFTNKLHEDFPDAASKLSAGHAYDLKTSVFEKLPTIFLDAKPHDGYEYIQIYGLLKMQRDYKWIRRDYVNAPAPLTKYKVIVPHSNGSGALGEVVSTPLVGSPLVGCTQTFITVGAFDTASEADACLAYIKTKFCRVMLGILKVTQHNPPSTWAKVPLQDFSASSDIDWTKPVAQIDEQLYRKYGLSDAEIKFIESHVKAME